MRFDLPKYAPSEMGLHWFLYDFWINEESNRILMRVLRWCNYCGILLVFRNEICLRETKAAHAPSECWEGCEEFSLCRPVRVYPGTYVVFSTAVCVFRSQFLFEEKCRTLVASWPARYVALEFVHHCYFYIHGTESLNLTQRLMLKLNLVVSSFVLEVRYVYGTPTACSPA